MKAALEVLPSIGTVDVYRTGPSGNGSTPENSFSNRSR